MEADAVFEGGGMKGIGLVGALSVAERKGFHFQRLAGTSVGALVAALYAAGYSSDEIYQILMEKDFRELIPKKWHNFIPGSQAIRLWFRQGLYSGDALEEWVGGLLAKRGIYTFTDLKECELRVITSDISRGSLLVLPHELNEYGCSSDSLTVARAIRMSTSIPYFYEPVTITHSPSQTTSYLVDGGVLSNFPVWLFDEEQPRWPTLGFRLITDEFGEPYPIDGPISLFRALFFTMMDAHDNRAIKEIDKLRSILIPTLGYGTDDFSIGKKEREELYQSGVEAAEAFFAEFSFSSYLAVRGKKSRLSYRLQAGKRDFDE
ncbi:patatin-like phospholipase family protein [Mechercharimyces sp. CAU 1602]|uniref:patatin-like phospholipase family protein n=1 Tax=Mechercharimyces sp. CAU 1602 TaxID=2973933 RepID=UPI0021633A42|nr:patatin-like phospholipase family protein [Mechercharimyces sp. CAU 1602]MCS1350742.1 patatin-like phospholipase family protein [Mechercharimyces sp. CAU 1602]